MLFFLWLQRDETDAKTEEMTDGVANVRLQQKDEDEPIQRRPKSQKKNLSDEEINEQLSMFINITNHPISNYNMFDWLLHYIRKKA